jgi:hypothetical protein
MNTLIRYASIVSTFTLMSAGLASAQEGYGDQNNYCAKHPDKCGTQQMQQSDEEDQGYTKKRRIQVDEDQGQVTVQPDQPRRHAQSDWQFDPNKHQRRRERSDRYRFELGGYWYPQPYWSIGIGPSRIGCGEGRAIVRDHGFYRVRTVECYGRAYTYVGRRHGETFQVLVSARSGRIIDVNPI